MSLASDLIAQLRSALSQIAEAGNGIAAARCLADEVVLEIQAATDGSGDEKPAEAMMRLQQAQVRLDEAAAEFEAGAAEVQAYIVDGLGDGNGSRVTSTISDSARVGHVPTPADSRTSTWRSAFASTQWIPEGTDRIPADWGEPKPNKKGVGYRWSHGPAQGVRIDKGDPASPSRSQRVDHVIVRDGGVVIGRDGNPIRGSIKDDPVNAHIPLSEWKTWKQWNRPN